MPFMPMEVYILIDIRSSRIIVLAVWLLVLLGLSGYGLADYLKTRKGILASMNRGMSGRYHEDEEVAQSRGLPEAATNVDLWF